MSTQITHVGTVIIPVADQDVALAYYQGLAEVMRMGDYVPPMFTFRDADGNRFRMVQRD